MKNLLTRVIALSVMVLFGLSTAAFARPVWAPDANETLLKAGIAVHSFGVSPDADAGDDHAVLRLYNVHERGYLNYDITAWDAQRPTNDFNQTYTYSDWTVEKIGNIYGIAIDRQKNIYVTASANWSPGYTGGGQSATNQVQVRYGDIGGGADDLNASGTIYRIDAKSGQAKVFAVLPQTAMNITHKVCGNNVEVSRTTGPGLGNVVYDKFHNQFFVSNFSDGKIYRIEHNGTVSSHSFNTGLGGIGSNGSAYGLAISPQGDKLFFGTIEIQGDFHNYKPRIFSVRLLTDGSFASTDALNALDQEAQLVENLKYSQNIGGSGVNDGTWAAYSDLSFTPDGELLAGVRVGCEDDFATSYNHGGVAYLLKQNNNGKYNIPSIKTTPTADQSTTYDNEPTDTNDATTRAGHSDKERFDAGSIPLRPKTSDTQNRLEFGPDDGYGGVAVWQDTNGTVDLFVTSSDISTETGVHGFMQFSGDFNITDKATIERAMGYKAVKSSTTATSNEDKKYDYKGIGGDVEVLSVVPVSIGSYAWIDDGDGKQDNRDVCLNGATVTLHHDENMSAKVYEIDGTTEVQPQDTHDCGKYHFENLPEGNYRVCITPPDNNVIHYEPTVDQNGGDNNDSEFDSNIKEEINGEYCSGMFTLVANSEPIESTEERGDKVDNVHDTWGNMTVDFGFVKKQFDLSIEKTLVNSGKTYHPGDDVNFTITVTNEGNMDATNVKIIDYVPAGLELVNSSDINKTIGAIAAGQSKPVTIPFKIKSDFQGTAIKNCTQISSAGNALGLDDKDSTPNNNAHNAEDDYDCAKVNVAQTFDLALVKVLKGSKSVYKPGETVTFVIGIKNQGTLTATNIQIRDFIPKGLVLNDSAWKESNGIATMKTLIPSLEPGKYIGREISFVIAKDFNETKIINVAEINSASNALGKDDIDSIPNDNPCSSDISNNNDIDSAKANANGCDDVDPAWLTVEQADKPTIIDADTITTSTATDTTSDTEKPCDCDNVTSNKANAMNTLALLLMSLGTLIVATKILRKEELLA